MARGLEVDIASTSSGASSGTSTMSKPLQVGPAPHPPPAAPNDRPRRTTGCCRPAGGRWRRSGTSVSVCDPHGRSTNVERPRGSSGSLTSMMCTPSWPRSSAGGFDRMGRRSRHAEHRPVAAERARLRESGGASVTGILGTRGRTVEVPSLGAGVGGVPRPDDQVRPPRSARTPGDHVALVADGVGRTRAVPPSR